MVIISLLIDFFRNEYYFQTHINENFAKLSEALYKADRVARDAVEKRAEMERRVAQNKKTEQEERMREVAKKAREVSTLDSNENYLFINLQMFKSLFQCKLSVFYSFSRILKKEFMLK